MNFLDALRSGRPIRRAAWVVAPPSTLTAEVQTLLTDSYWAYPVAVYDPSKTCGWIQLINGSPQRIGRLDYLAEDWEVMP